MLSTAENWLSLDMSSSTGSLALHRAENGRLTLLAEVDLPDGGKHSEAFLPALQTILGKADLTPQQIHRWITCSGPGSFTGLRIAYAGIKAFSLATGACIEILHAHEARALSYCAQTQTKPPHFWVQTQVAREKFLQTEFEWVDDTLQMREEILVEKVTALAELRLTDKPTQDGGTVFPLHARFLAENLLQAKSRKTLREWDAIAFAAPDYFGSRNY